MRKCKSQPSSHKPTNTDLVKAFPPFGEDGNVMAVNGICYRNMVETFLWAYLNDVNF